MGQSTIQQKLTEAGAALSSYLLSGPATEWLRRWFALPPFTHRAGRSWKSVLPMRDGVRLVTRVYLPEGAGPWPALLVRNPYNLANHFGVICRALGRYGYAIVHQDCRGRFESEGEWTPLRNERADGLDTLAWLRQQPWQSNRIALVGLSYLAAVQWVVADELPPEVKTIVPAVFSTDFHGSMYQSGMFRHELGTVWAAFMARRGVCFENARRWRRAVAHFPHREADRLYLGGELPWYREWIASPCPSDPLWNTPDLQSMAGLPERVRVPVLMLAAWYDLFCRGMFADFARLGSRPASRLLVGPWTHLLGVYGDGDRDFAGNGGFGALVRQVMAWLGHHLRDEPLDGPTGTVHTFAIGEGRWHVRDHWPPRTTARRLHLAHAAGCRTRSGGLLVDDPPAATEAATYAYDPRRPAPSLGGGETITFSIPGFGGTRPSSVRQPPPGERSDVLSFVSSPLDPDLHLAGEVRVSLSVSTDALDTAFTAKLIEVQPDGRPYNIRESIASLAYRDGGPDPAPVPYRPGDRVRVTLALAPIEWRLARGSRLRLDVSSSSFPMYHAHPNRAGLWCDVADPVVARQTIYLGGPEGS